MYANKVNIDRTQSTVHTYIPASPTFLHIYVSKRFHPDFTATGIGFDVHDWHHGSFVRSHLLYFIYLVVGMLN